MREHDGGVAMARWEPEAAMPAIAAVRDEVGSFAAAHGMSRDTREDVRAAVAEAVADADESPAAEKEATCSPRITTRQFPSSRTSSWVTS